MVCLRLYDWRSCNPGWKCVFFIVWFDNVDNENKIQMSEFVFRSGKHKGKSLQLVKKIDPGYVEWVRENQPKMLEEYKPKPKPTEPAPRREPPEDSEVPESSLKPNTNFWNEGPHGKLE
jgi:hypothetical protein